MRAGNLPYALLRPIIIVKSMNYEASREVAGHILKAEKRLGRLFAMPPVPWISLIRAFIPK